jgi:hypothetical protein
VIVQRVLAVLAAVLLVGAVAVAVLAPPGMSLGAVLLAANHDLLDTLQGGIEAYFDHWLWADVVLPLLVRPAWLLPAAVGLVCAGAALTLSNLQRPQRSSRRRF